jgi:hypothetical protein
MEREQEYLVGKGMPVIIVPREKIKAFDASLEGIRLQIGNMYGVNRFMHLLRNYLAALKNIVGYIWIIGKGV